MKVIKQFLERIVFWWKIVVKFVKFGYTIFYLAILGILEFSQIILNYLGINIPWFNNISLKPIIVIVFLLLLFLEVVFRNDKEKEKLIEDLKRGIDKMLDIKFSISIKGIIFKPLQDGVNIILTIYIENLGLTNSIAKNWNLLIQVPGEDPKRTLPTRIGCDNDVDIIVNNVKKTIKSSECLVDKTQNTEIVGGGAVEGKLSFLVRGGVSRDNQLETKFILSVQDKHGKEYCKTEVCKDIHNKNSIGGTKFREFSNKA